jgi:hypothetical protein
VPVTISEIFDALNRKSFRYLETKDGSKFGGTPMQVNFCSDEALEPACLEVTEDGLVLHFNSQRFSEMRGESVLLTDIVAVR